MILSFSLIDWMDGFSIFIHPFIGWMVFPFSFIHSLDGCFFIFIHSFIHEIDIFSYSFIGWMVFPFSFIHWMDGFVIFTD